MRIFKIIIGIIACAGLLGASLVICLNTRVITSASDYVITDFSGLSGYDCILVLGAGVRPGGEPSPMLRDRLSRALELYEAGVSGKLVMSGDHGSEYYDEVNAMKNWAVDAGAASEDVFMDHAGFSTYESLYRLKEVFCAESVVIVTLQGAVYGAGAGAGCCGRSGGGDNLFRADIPECKGACRPREGRYICRNKAEARISGGYNPGVGKRRRNERLRLNQIK